MDNRIRKAQRAVITVKDIITITGRKRVSAWRMYRAIQQTFRKQPNQFITFQEFSIYTGIDEEEIRICLKY